jgi:DnaK suppressor protein
MAAKKAAKKVSSKASPKTVAKKAAAKPVKKPAANASKPLAKKPAPVAKKKPIAKPAAKKPAAKPVAKKAKAPAKPVKKAPAAKPVAKKVVAKKPAPKAVVKKAPAKPVKKVAVKFAKPVAKQPAPVRKAPAKPVVVAKPVKAAAPLKTAAPAPAKKALVKKTFIPKRPMEVEAPTIIVEPITDPKFLVFVEKQKSRLLDLRDTIVDAMTGSAREAIRSSPEGSEASGSGMHQGDAGSDAYDRDFALSVLAKDQEALYEIEEALLRIKKGTYGLCEMSGKRIPIPRLEAIPFARLTVECQAQWEKDYGTKKFRPSGSVGFSGGTILEEDEDSETISLDEDED